MSQMQWAIIRRALFVMTLVWLFGVVSWTMLPVPAFVGMAGLVALATGYVYTLTKWKLPKSPFDHNIADDSHFSNIVLKETFVSAIIALPALLGLVWLSYRVA